MIIKWAGQTHYSGHMPPTVHVFEKPGVDFNNVQRTAFTLVDPKSAKNTVKSSVSYYAFRIYERKSCT